MQNLGNKIKYCVNNECAGPNVEQMIGIGVGLAVAVGLYKVASIIGPGLKKSSQVVDKVATKKASSATAAEAYKVYAR